MCWKRSFHKSVAAAGVHCKLLLGQKWLFGSLCSAVLPRSAKFHFPICTTCCLRLVVKSLHGLKLLDSFCTHTNFLMRFTIITCQSPIYETWFDCPGLNGLFYYFCRGSLGTPRRRIRSFVCSRENKRWVCHFQFAQLISNWKIANGQYEKKLKQLVLVKELL